VLDLDWRPMLWEGTAAYRAYVGALLPFVDVVIGNESEFRAVRDGDPVEIARHVQGAGPRLVVLKRGGAGVLALHDGGAEDVPGLPVEVINGLGAGDAFCASLLDSLLRGLSVGDACRRGNAAGAIVATRLACSQAMPTSAEVDELLATGIAPPQP
jgi:5-dehydro-2-deoxygluconokinase